MSSSQIHHSFSKPWLGRRKWIIAMVLLSCGPTFAEDKPAAAPGAGTALEPWASKAQPGDVARSHVKDITTREHTYIVVHGGTMDGTNCRSPMGCGMNREGAIEQSWQSNRAVRMENVGQTDVVDAWLFNGRNNFRNIKEMVAAAVTGLLVWERVKDDKKR